MGAFLKGLGVGAAMGVLFARREGRETRRRLRSSLKDLGHRADELRNKVRGVTRAEDSILSQETARSTAAAQMGLGSVGNDSAQFLNTARLEDLLAVSGIGPVLANRIIAGRPYASDQQLLDHGVVPQSLLDELRLHSRERRSA